MKCLAFKTKVEEASPLSKCRYLERIVHCFYNSGLLHLKIFNLRGRFLENRSMEMFYQILILFISIKRF